MKKPIGGVKFFMDGYFPAEFFHQHATEYDRVAFESEIKVEDGASQHQVADRTADEVEGKAERGGFVRDAVD